MNKRISDVEIAPHLAAEIHHHRWFFWSGGSLSLLLGIAAIAMPYLATLATEIALGAVFVAAGLVQCIAAFEARKAGRVATGFFVGLLGVAVGGLLLLYPVGGIVALTLILAIFFLASGILKFYFGWRLRPSAGHGWMMLGGVLSFVLGLLVWSGFPGTAFWVLGLFVGIDLIFYGMALLMVARAAQKIDI